MSDQVRLFVSIGTDHHPFVRLVGWVVDLAEANPDWQVVLQHGRTPAPRSVPNLEAFAFCDHARLLELFAGSTAVVSHGGPATITEARRNGHVPVVVARNPEFGEHVDGHQMLFATRLAGAGVVTPAASAAELDLAVRAAHARRSADDVQAATWSVAVPDGVHRVGQVAEEVVRAARARGRRSGAAR